MTSGDASSVDLAALSERLDSITRVVRNTATKAQPVAESKSDKGDSADANTIATAINSKEDTSSSPSEVAEPKSPLDDFTLENAADDENRNKR